MMIYLIWWVPRCGKSTVAKTIAHKIGVWYVWTDYIASAIWSKVTEEEDRRLFGEKRRDDANRVDNETRFSVFSNEEQIQHYRIKAQQYRQWIKNMIDYFLIEEETYILEWFHLRPEIIAPDLIRWWDKVKYMALYKSDIDEIEKWIKTYKHPNDRATQKTYKEETYPKIASFIYEFGQMIKNDAMKYGLETCDMSQWVFDDNIQKVASAMIE